MSKDKSIKKENNKKEPVKSLKEKRADKKAKQEEKKKKDWAGASSDANPGGDYRAVGL